LSSEAIRQLLHRRDLAAARYRSAIGRRLGLCETDMLAVWHLAQHGRLTPGELAQLLDLSSGGMSAVIARLETKGHVVREPHPTDGRSTFVRLSPEMVALASSALAPLVNDLDRLIKTLEVDQMAVVSGSRGLSNSLSATPIKREGSLRARAPQRR
jgi:DNA-binding MarR family transcriptional regulator